MSTLLALWLGRQLRRRANRSSSRAFSLACHRSFHFDLHAHPRMDTALKTVFTFRQTRDLDLAALKDSSLSHRDVRKAAGTFRNRVLSRHIELRYEAATEVRHLGECVRLAALHTASGDFL